MSIAQTFDELIAPLPDDWTDLEFDLRIFDETRYVDAAIVLVTCNAQPHSKRDWHWHVVVAHRFGHGASVPAVQLALRLLDDSGIDAGEAAVSGRLRAPSGAYRLESTAPGMLDKLALRPAQHRSPGPGEVEVQVLAAGVNFRDVMKALGTARATGLPAFVSQQVYLSLQERSAEYEIVPSAIDQGLGLLIWSPLAGGLLSGKYRRGAPAPAGSRHAGEWSEPPIYDEDKLYDTIEVLVEVADHRGVSAAQVALAWVLARPGVTSTIVGARTEEQLADNLAAATLELTADEHARLEAVSRPPLLYPFWHHRNAAGDRLSAADLSLISAHTGD